MIGNITLTLPSLLSLTSQGIKVKVSNIFLCLEMLEVKKWSEELVIKKYQASKKATLNTLQQNTDIVYADYQEEEKKLFSVEFLHKMLANLKIEIENVHLLYEDQTFKFSTGILLPKIEVQSLNELWEIIEKVDDPTVIYKKLTISNVSVFVNNSKYQSIEDILSQANIKQSIKDFKNWSKEDLLRISDVAIEYLKMTFEDSSKRLTQLLQTKNQYIFQEKEFCIDLVAQVTLNKLNALVKDSKFCQPDFKLDVMFGGLFGKKQSHDQVDQDHYLGIVIAEEQIEALLHFGTFLGAYNNFSFGVLKKVFLSDKSKILTPQVRSTYMNQFLEFLKNKTEGKLTQIQINTELDKLWLIEQDYRTDIIVRMRKACIEKYFSERKVKESFDKKVIEIKNQKKSWYSSAIVEKQKQGKLDEAQKKMKQRMDELVRVYELHVLEIEGAVSKQFQKENEAINGAEVQIREIVKTSEQTEQWIQINFRMPKKTISVYTSRLLQQNLNQLPICFIGLQGVNVNIDVKSLPDRTSLQFSLDSFEVLDPRVNSAIRQLNPEISDSRKVSAKVIETFSDDLDVSADQNGKSDKSKLINLAVIIQEEDTNTQKIASYQQKSDPLETDLASENELFQNQNQSKEMMTRIKLDIVKKVYIYSNFYFVKNLLYLGKRIVADMNQKRDKLLELVDDKCVKMHIQDGLKVVQKLSQFAADNISKMKTNRLKNTANSQMSFSLRMISPKLIIDEYLLSEKVVNPVKPCYFLLDMGLWEISTSIVKQNVEIQPIAQQFTVENDQNFRAQTTQAMYESLDMVISDLKVLYSCEDYLALLDDANGDNFVLFDKFSIGFQHQTLVGEDENHSRKMPNSQINLKFKKLKLNLERSVFRQLLKVKTFLAVGSFNDGIKELVEELAKGAAKSEIKSQSSSSASIGDEDQIQSLQQQPQTLRNRRSRSLSDDQQIVEQPQNEKTESEMRVNLLFQGLGITFKKFEQTKNSTDANLLRTPTLKVTKSHKKPKPTLKDILLIEGQCLKISCHMSNNPKELSVVVLLSKLKIKDLYNQHYHFKNIVKIASKQNNPQSKQISQKVDRKTLEQLGGHFKLNPRDTLYSDGLRKNQNRILKIFNGKSPRGQTQKYYATNNLQSFNLQLNNQQQMNDFTFDELKNFYPRQEFKQGIHQVSVHFSSSSQSQPSLLHQMLFEESSTVVKFQPLQLIGHFNLISQVMQSVFDVLHDLANVEKLYKEHVQKGKKNIKFLSQTLSILKTAKENQIQIQINDQNNPSIKNDELNNQNLEKLQNKCQSDKLTKMLQKHTGEESSQKVEHENINQRFVLQSSKLVVFMPKLQLTIPTDLENENCMSLQMQTDFKLEQNSNEQRCVKYSQIQSDQNEPEELILADQKLDSQSQITVKLGQVQLYMKTVNDDILNLQSKQDQGKKLKFLKDQLISPFDFQFQSQTTSYANHDYEIHNRHLVTLDYSKFSSLKPSDFKREKEMREKIRNSIEGTKTEMIVLATSRIDIEQHFKIQVRVRQLRNYMKILQLITYQQQQIGKVVATDYTEDYSVVASINPSEVLNEKIIKETTLARIGGSQEKNQNKSKQQIQIIDQNPQKISWISDNNPDEKEDGTLEKLQVDKKLVKEKNISLEELIEQNRIKESSQDQTDNINRSKTLQQIEGTKFTIKKSSFVLETKGMAISLLDDITSQYEESLIQINFDNLDLSQQSLDDTDHKLNFLQKERLREIINLILDRSNLFPDPDYKNLLSLKIDMTVQASYFNHKSFGEEDLLEETKFVIEQIQPGPATPLNISITSHQFLNINLSYGCILSIYKVIQAIKEEESNKAKIQLPVTKVLADFNDLLSQPSEFLSKSNVILENQNSEDEQSNSESDSVLSFNKNDYSFTKMQQTEKQVHENYSMPSESHDDEHYDSQLRSRNRPKFRFFNLTGKTVVFSISNESQSSQNEEQQVERKLFTIEPSQNSASLNQSLHVEIQQLVKLLLKSYKTEELKFAQLYLSFQVVGYKEIQDISLNQYGVFGYNLKNLKNQEGRKKKNQYCVIRTVRNRGETNIYFESNSVVLNTSEKAIVLSAFKQYKEQEVPILSQLTASHKKVEVLPLGWFEEDLQVQLSFVATSMIEKLVPNQNNFMFRHGTIKSVLNPKITNPYHENSCQIKLDDKWFALEFALLGTRTQIPQFLIMIHPLTTFHNLMFSPLKIQPVTQIQDAIQISVSSTLNAQLDRYFQPNCYTLQPNETNSIDEINLQSSNDFDKKFLIQLNISEEKTAADFIGFDQIAKMGKNQRFQFQKGIVIDLKIANQNQVQKISNPYQEPKAICCIMEKVASLDSIIDTDYNNFTLRQRIYHQSASQRYEFYVPLVAVNQTPYDIQILQNNQRHIGMVKKCNNLLVDLKEIKESKLRIKIEDFLMSDKIDMNTAGVHGSVVMKQEIQKNETQKNLGKFANTRGQQQCKTLEIGTSIRFCDYPFVKTKVIRFTNRFQLVNKLGYPIVIRETVQSQQYCVGVQGVMNLNFDDQNKSKDIQIRMCSDEDIKKLNESKKDWVELPKSVEFLMQQSQWSLNFSGVDVDDFQLTLPKIIKKNQYDDSELKNQKKIKQDANRQGWDNHQWDRKIVRVTITNDPDFTEKLYCIISKPLHPDYLFLNYLNCPIQVQHKIISKKQGEQQVSKILQIDSVPQEEQIDPNKVGQLHGVPSGMPVVLNPYKQHKKKTLDIFFILDTIKQVSYTIDTEQHYKIDEGQNVLCRTRVAGNMRIIELYRVGLMDRLQRQASLISPSKDKRQCLLHMLREKILSKGVSDEIDDYQLDLQSLNIQVAGVGISLIDFMPQELCYISIDTIYLKQETSFVKLGMYEKTITEQNFQINNFQIDAMQNEIFPVLLGPKVPYRNIERLYQKENSLNVIKDTSNPILRLINIGNEVNDGSIKTNTIEDFKFELAEIEFKLHLGFVLEIQALLNSLSTLVSDFETIKKSNFIRKLKETQQVMNGESKYPIWQDQRQFKENGKVDKFEHRFSQISMYEEQKFSHALTQPDQLILETLVQPDEDSKESQLDSNSEQIKIQPKEKVCPCIKAQLNSQFSDIDLVRVKKIFVESLNIKAIKCFMTMRIRGIEKNLNKSGPMGFMLNLGSNFADITDAEFNFSELDMIKQQKSDVLLQNSLIHHYQNEAIQQFYQILGSQDIIGNPSNFLTNITKGTEDLQNQPLQGLLQYNAKMAATGIGRGILGLCANTTYAVSSSYAGIAGSLYLGLKNLSGANLTHAQLDQPLTFFGGVQKGTIGFFKEVAQGVTGVYKIPKQKIQTQGKGVSQLAKGVGQGVIQATLFPVNSSLRFSYNISTGIKNQVKGIRDHGQRYRYPRYFDQNEKMPPYNHQNSHAYHALSCTKNGQYRHEVVKKVYDVSNYTRPGCEGFFKDRVVIITNKSLFFIESNHKLLNYIPLGQIKGMMFYFYAKKYGSIVLEISNKKGGNRIVKLDTQQPEINQIILQDLKSKLEQLEKLQLGVNDKKDFSPLTQSIQPKPPTPNQVVNEVNFQSPNLSIVADPGIPALVSHSSRGSIQSDNSQGDNTYLTWETIEVPNE